MINWRRFFTLENVEHTVSGVEVVVSSTGVMRVNVKQLIASLKL